MDDASVDAPMPTSDARIDAFVPTSDAGHCATPAACEQATADRLDAISGDPDALLAFVRAMPKGGDLHNHLTGAVYAETYLDWALADHDCIQTSNLTAVYASSCGASTMPVPTMGAFRDQIVAAWSMQGFVPSGSMNGHDHFFATFSKYGAVAGAHRDDDIADVATRAASENQVYLETMFNLGTHVGTLAASVWSGTLTAADLPAFYTMLHGNAGFANAVAQDVAVVRSAASSYRTTLGCSGATPPAACNVRVRFIAQVSRTGASDQVFGQLVGAYEMAIAAPELVGANLSSPEDDSRSLNGYALHMAMLDFLHGQYTTSGTSPLHITLHAGELVPMYLPSGSTDNTFHIRSAVETGHAERIGHGIDILSETNATALLDEMASRNVLVEVCLSSNAQILEVSGAAHPLAQYLAHHVPVALATDDQGVSRSSLAGEIVRAVEDQHLGYLELKAMARASLEHSFLPGASLFTSVSPPTLVAACDPIAATPTTACQAVLDASERAAAQYELERRFVVFEATN